MPHSHFNIGAGGEPNNEEEAHAYTLTEKILMEAARSAAKTDAIMAPVLPAWGFNAEQWSVPEIQKAYCSDATNPGC